MPKVPEAVAVLSVRPADIAQVDFEQTKKQPVEKWLKPGVLIS
jgi:hypothetical protein